MRLIVKRFFDAAHYLEDYDGPCGSIHGHTWTIEVYVKIGDDSSLQYDFYNLKHTIDSILPHHKFLNEYYKGMNPTVENLSRRIMKELQKELPVEKVILWETATSGVETE